MSICGEETFGGDGGRNESRRRRRRDERKTLERSLAPHVALRTGTDGPPVCFELVCLSVIGLFFLLENLDMKNCKHKLTMNI